MAWYRPDQTRRTDATEVAPLPCGTGSKAVKQTTKERFNEMEKAPAHRTDRSFHSTIKSESECRPMASRALWSEIVADTQTTHGERVRRGCLTCHFHTIYIRYIFILCLSKLAMQKPRTSSPDAPFTA